MRVTATSIFCSALLLGSAAASPCRNPNTGGRGDEGHAAPVYGTLPPATHTPYPVNGTVTTSAGGVPPVSSSAPVSFPGGAFPTISVPPVAGGTNSASSSAPVAGGPSATSSGAPVATPAPGGAVPAGKAIFKCTVPGTVALTFDDGPSAYTTKALDLLKAAGFSATFFLNGDNYSKIENRVPEVLRMLAENHQIGSHTWNHPHLSQLTDPEVRSQMFRLEEALFKIIGKIPTHMRPPYFDYNDATLASLGAIGYKVIHADIDTQDWQFNTQQNFQAAVTNFRTGLSNNGSIALMHDVHFGTIEYVLPEVIKAVQEAGLRAVSVGECLGESPSDWYRGPRPAADVTIPTGVIGPGAACAGPEGYVCAVGNCCSQYNFCGTTTDHCGTGCQSAFGLCN
ncbi:peptidoglycan-N-acetylglucosamine deacetylase [Microdochium nivale]|nr:peptidoglycan-N-acetylglucosamine deacetylase [Microdochium nivale]